MEKFKFINNKPRLVDNKILYQIKQKKIIDDFNYNKYIQIFINFLYKNIGFILFFLMLTCVLTYRYYEVKKKKNEMKKNFNYTYI
tara:strand:+ start:77 stop:331 length:255 start_codon:yes stop_codon:yes gene_type:complete